jgi:hypothetical protein
MTDEDLARIGSRFDDGNAAVGALVPGNQAEEVSDELEALGGMAEVHEVSPDDLSEAAPNVVPPT